ncbi:MAG: AAA family ATPase [Flavobacteriales bacterium]|nr:AAA family ATPase [Flavobacteriales bacterium]
MTNEGGLQNRGKDKIALGVYGRENELATIAEAVDELILNNRYVCLEVSGDAGTGKTFLIKNSLGEIPAIRVFYATFGPDAEARPYSVVNDFFDQLVSFLKERKSDAELSIWHTSLKELIKELPSEILNSIPFISELTLSNNRSQSKKVNPGSLKSILENFYIDLAKSIFLEVDFKIALVLDNVQFYEEKSMQLLFKIFRGASQPLMIVLSGRPGRWQEHRREMLSGFLSENTVSVSVHLGPFNVGQIAGFIVYLLGGKRVLRLDDLSLLFFETTAGNVNTLYETVLRLKEEGALIFDTELDSWQWSIESGRFDQKLSIVSVFMQKFEELDERSKEVLFFASCLLKNINPVLVAKLTPFDLSSATQILSYCNEKGFLDVDLINTQYGNESRSNYHFSSDEVAAAIKGSMPDRKSQQYHRNIVNYFLTRNAIGISDRDVLDGAYHLMHSKDIESTTEEKKAYLMLYTKAANQSRLLTSFEQGYLFIEIAKPFAESLLWTKDRTILSEYYKEAYQLARLTNNRLSADEFMRVASENLDADSKYEISFQKMVLDIQLGLLNDGLQTGVKLLNELGLKVGAKASQLTVIMEFLKAKRLLGKTTIEKIYDMPEVKDIRLERIFQVIFWLFRASQYLAPELNGVLALKQLQLTLKHGTNAESWSGLMAYGVIIGVGMNDYKTAYDYAHLGGRLADKYGNRSGKVEFGRAIYHPFRNSLMETISMYENSKAKQCREGDYLGAAEATVNESLTYFSLGGSLNKVLDRVNENYEFCSRVSALDFTDFQRMLSLKLNCMMSGSLSKEDAFELNKIIKASEFKMIHSVETVLNLIEAFLKQEYEAAYKIIKEGRKLVNNLTGLYFKSEFAFYEVLTCLALSATGKGSLSMRRKVNQSVSKFEKWTKSAPDNYQHKLELIKGAVHLLDSNLDQASLSFQKALKLGLKQDNFIVQAYALRGMGRIEGMRGAKDREEEFLISSCDQLREWGLQWK